MQVKVDSMGRIVIPKPLRQALGIEPGSTVDVSEYGAGLTVTPGGRTARLVYDDEGRLVATGETTITNADVLALIDAGRR